MAKEIYREKEKKKEEADQLLTNHAHTLIVCYSNHLFVFLKKKEIVYLFLFVLVIHAFEF